MSMTRLTLVGGTVAYDDVDRDVLRIDSTDLITKITGRPLVFDVSFVDELDGTAYQFKLTGIRGEVIHRDPTDEELEHIRTIQIVRAMQDVGIGSEQLKEILEFARTGVATFKAHLSPALAARRSRVGSLVDAAIKKVDSL